MLNNIEIYEYANFLGMKLPEDEEFLWIAEEGVFDLFYYFYSLKLLFQNHGKHLSVLMKKYYILTW